LENVIVGKGIKIAIIVGLPVLALGVTWGLAKFNVIPVRKMAEKNPKILPVLKALKLDSPQLPARSGSAVAAQPDPLEGEKKALQAQRDTLEDERKKWEAQRQSQLRQEADSRAAALRAAPDPKNIARMASVYEQMPAETVTLIFGKMRDDQVIALLRRMDEKQVGQVLAAMAPDRAARLTLALTRPAPDRIASTTP
jgi:flagellar motility protein MotE (MotC chaperone)